MKFREEIIGDCRPTLGKVDAVVTYLYSPFRFHMAGLAKPYKVVSLISFLGCFKESVRNNVMNGQRLAYVLPAMSAMPILINNYFRTNIKPSFTAICCYTANITRRFIPFKNTRSFKTFSSAKFCEAILFGQPKFLTKRTPAMFAGSFNTIFPSGVFFADKSFFKRISRALSSPKLVSNKVFFWAYIKTLTGGHYTSALLRAVFGLFSTIRLYFVRYATFFTDNFNAHKLIIAQLCFGSMKNRSTYIACRRIEEAYKQPDLFIESPVKPKQEDLLK